MTRFMPVKVGPERTIVDHAGQVNRMRIKSFRHQLQIIKGIHSVRNFERSTNTLSTMRKLLFIALIPGILATQSCVSTKKYKQLDGDYASLKDMHEKTSSDLGRTQRDLVSCLSENRRLTDELDHLRKMNERLTSGLGEMAALSRQEAENLQKSLQKIQEKDLQIKTLNEALTRKDSVTIALVTSLKRAVGIHDEDIQISVEKGVVFVSISDKFLFRSGSYQINVKAKEVLAKVAKVLESQPQLEVMVEGHTDNVSFRRGELLDNWDLSVKRSTALVRMLQQDFSIDPARMIAAGRGEYIPVAGNSTAEGRASNRRTRIILLPKLEEFFGMIEQELKGK
jgi:chemotaxis protein MotB